MCNYNGGNTMRASDMMSPITPSPQRIAVTCQLVGSQVTTKRDEEVFRCNSVKVNREEQHVHKDNRLCLDLFVTRIHRHRHHPSFSLSRIDELNRPPSSACQPLQDHMRFGGQPDGLLRPGTGRDPRGHKAPSVVEE